MATPIYIMFSKFLRISEKFQIFKFQKKVCGAPLPVIPFKRIVIPILAKRVPRNPPFCVLVGCITRPAPVCDANGSRPWELKMLKSRQLTCTSTRKGYVYTNVGRVALIF